MGGCNDVAHRSVRSIMVGGNTSLDRMSESAIMAVRKAVYYRWRRESSIRILLILTPRRSS